MKNEQKGALKPLNLLFIKAGGHLFDEKQAKRCPNDCNTANVNNNVKLEKFDYLKQFSVATTKL